MDEDDVMRRALAAYFRSGGTDQPSARASGIRHLGSLGYAVLRTSDRMLAVYRVRSDGMLKRLKRWPAQLEEF